MSSTRGNLRGYLERRFIQFLVLIERLEEIRLLLFNWIIKVNRYTEVMCYSTLTTFSRGTETQFITNSALSCISYFNWIIQSFSFGWLLISRTNEHFMYKPVFLQSTSISCGHVSTPNNFRLWLQIINNPNELCCLCVCSDWWTATDYLLNPPVSLNVWIKKNMYNSIG